MNANANANAIYSSTAIFSGKATLICTNPTGLSHTLHITTKPDRSMAFIYLNSTYIGIIFPKNTVPNIKLTAKSGVFRESKEYAIAQFILHCTLGIRNLPENYTIQHNGTCFCCGRELTNPESIANGIGPICAEKLGAN